MTRFEELQNVYFDKCILFKYGFVYLGHIFNNEGTWEDPEKLNATINRKRWSVDSMNQFCPLYNDFDIHYYLLR